MADDVASKPSERGAGSPSDFIIRQAVVVIHGQGEQRPMGTIRDFVKVLWQFNPDLGPLPPKSQTTDGRQVWIVPDDKSGLFELQRVTTPRHNGCRTDFFELYYADLLNDTPIRNLWRWMQRLLWIDPADVPDEMRLPWTMFWLLSLSGFGLCLFVLLSVPYVLHGSWLDAVSAPRALPGLIAGGTALLVLLLPKFFRWLQFLEAVPVLLIVAVGAAAVVQVYQAHPIALALIALLAMVYLAAKFLLPFFGDAASYLSAQTETVQSRQVVRNRGLALLRALHDDPAYDRVIVIGHSLGTVLAYDLLHILWQEAGPTRDNPPEPAAVAALQAVDEFAASCPAGRWSPQAVQTYQDLQWRAFDALRRQRAGTPTSPQAPKRAGWKISDFVALGSPLASAPFLIAESRADFIRMKQERMLPTAPPQPYDENHLALYCDERGRTVTHHAAVFSTVRWTNIYDQFESPLFLLGDPIAGPVSGIDCFGDAILDRNVEIKWGPLGSRFFTHNWYWTETSADWMSPSAHIAAFRDAVGLERSPPAAVDKGVAVPPA